MHPRALASCSNFPQREDLALPNTRQLLYERLSPQSNLLQVVTPSVIRQRYNASWPAANLYASVTTEDQHGWKNLWSYGKKKTCTIGNALELYQLGFDITSISSRDDEIRLQALQPFITAKHLTREQRRAHKRPPLTTVALYNLRRLLKDLRTSAPLTGEP